MIPIGRGARGQAEYDRLRHPGTETLVSLLDIRDPLVLEMTERRLAKSRLGQGLPADADPRTYAGFKAIHRHLFQDVYAWAGRERAYTTGRGPVPFATPENIRPWAEKQFDALKSRGYLRKQPPPAFARGAAELVNELNAAHPFVEGNGRTQRVWLRALAAQAGHLLTLRTGDRDAWYEASRIGFERGDHRPDGSPP